MESRAGVESPTDRICTIISSADGLAVSVSRRPAVCVASASRGSTHTSMTATTMPRPITSNNTRCCLHRHKASVPSESTRYTPLPVEPVERAIFHPGHQVDVDTYLLNVCQSLFMRRITSWLLNTVGIITWMLRFEVFAFSPCRNILFKLH